MSVKVKYDHWLFKLWFMSKFTGFSLPDRIWLRYTEAYYLVKYGVEYLEELIRHEKIHGIQVIYCGGWINFLILYGYFYTFGLFRYKFQGMTWKQAHWKAYTNIKFEREA